MATARDLAYSEFNARRCHQLATSAAFNAKAAARARRKEAEKGPQSIHDTLNRIK